MKLSNVHWPSVGFIFFMVFAVYWSEFRDEDKVDHKSQLSDSSAILSKQLDALLEETNRRLKWVQEPAFNEYSSLALLVFESDTDTIIGAEYDANGTGVFLTSQCDQYVNDRSNLAVNRGELLWYNKSGSAYAMLGCVPVYKKPFFGEQPATCDLFVSAKCRQMFLTGTTKRLTVLFGDSGVISKAQKSSGPSYQLLQVMAQFSLPESSPWLVEHTFYPSAETDQSDGCTVPDNLSMDTLAQDLWEFTGHPPLHIIYSCYQISSESGYALIKMVADGEEVVGDVTTTTYKK